jgi:biotin carboxylase
MLPSRADYGLGVLANDRLLVERYLTGRFIGVDTLTADGRHTLLGVHEKLMFPPPAFAMRGSTFVPNTATTPVAPEIERFVCAMLDAVGFDCGATHIEMMLTADGPRLIEINPRLVGAKMPRLVNHALGRSVHADLIAVHLGQPVTVDTVAQPAFGVIRWIVADRPGLIEAVELPAWHDARIRCVDILKQPGDRVAPPFENADRIGCVMVCSRHRAEAEELAERYVAQAVVRLQPADAALARRTSTV